MPQLAPNYSASKSSLLSTISGHFRKHIRTWLALASMLVLVLLSGCSNAPPATQQVAAPALPVPTDRAPLPDPLPIQTLPFKWSVVTPKTLPAGSDWVLFALPPKDYENMAKSQADTLRWICEAAWLLKHYHGTDQQKPECGK